MKNWIKELCPEIADWQAELIAEHCQPKRTWVGLTDEEIDYFIVHRLTIATKNNLAALIRICEAKLKEKNQ